MEVFSAEMKVKVMKKDPPFGEESLRESKLVHILVLYVMHIGKHFKMYKNVDSARNHMNKVYNRDAI